MQRRRPRLETFDYLGKYRYFLTFCTHDRRNVFIAPDTFNLVNHQILRTCSTHAFSVPAYVYMPDHVHLLVEGLSDGSDLRAFVKLAKQKSGYEYSKRYQRPLWQPSYYDRVLRDDEDSLAVMRYILSNPLRAGLVSQCEDYPFLGSTTHELEEILDACADQPWVGRRA